MTAFSGGTIDGSILPSQTGHDLGSAAQRWDLFSQDADISGSLTNPALPPLDPAGRVRFNSPTVFNSTFEEGGTAAPGDVASGWAEYSTFAGGTFSNDINTVYSGIRSLKVHGIATHYQSLINRARFAVTVGDTISVRGAYYTSASTVLAYSRVTFFDKNDVFTDGAYIVNGLASVGSWTYASGSKVVPAGSVYAAWEIGYHANSTTDGDCFFDALWVGESGTSVASSRLINTTSPLTGGGDLSTDRTIAFSNQSANQVLAGPTSGVAAAPAFRALVSADIVNNAADSTGKSAKTDALNSATTAVNVSSATAPSAGQLLQATSSTAATWQSRTIAIPFIIDGGGSAITAGEKGHLEIPFACTITGWTILADQSGSIVVAVAKDTYANFPPTFTTDEISGSEKPTLSSVQKNQDLSLSTWTTAIAAGSILAFNVDSITTCTRVLVSLRATIP